MTAQEQKIKLTNRWPHEGCPERGYPIGQTHVIRACLEYDNVVAIFGRSWGKTAICGMLGYEEGRLYRGFYDFAYCAPTNRLAKHEYRRWKKIFRALINPNETWDSEQILTLRPFGNNLGFRADFWGLEEHDNLRGYRKVRIIVDERKDVAKEAVTDTLAAMLMGRDGKMLHIGTPKRTGKGARAFRTDYLKGCDPEHIANKTWISFNAPSHANPHLTDKDIQGLINRCDDEKTVREEVYAEFLDEDASVFGNFRNVFSIKDFRTFKVEAAGEKILINPVDPVSGHPNLWVAEPPSQGDSDWMPDDYAMGLDLGEKNDRTIATGFNRRTKRQAFLMRLVRMDYLDQLPLIDWIIQYYNGAHTVYDGSAHGAVVTSALARKYGDGCVARDWQGVKRKIEDITRGKILCSGAGREGDDPYWHMMDVLFQRNEWESYEVETHTTTGRPLKVPRYGAPPGLYDDTVAAGCLIADVVMAPNVRRKRAPGEAVPFSGRWFREEDVKSKRKKWWDRVKGKA